MSSTAWRDSFRIRAKKRAASLSPSRRGEIGREAIRKRWLEPDMLRRLCIKVPNSSLFVIRDRAQKNGRTLEEEAAEIIKSFTTQWDI